MEFLGILAGVAVLVGVAGGYARSVAGTWRDGERYVKLEQSGPFVRGRADLDGGHGPGDRIVAVNMGAEPARLDVTGTVIVASDGRGEVGPFDGTLAADHAVLLDPTG